MRTMVVIMGILSVFGLGASAQAPEQDKAPRGAVTLKVSGMSCGACAARVQKAAKGITGVESAEVSQPKGTAAITFDPDKISAESIAELITKKSGFVAEVSKKK